MIAPTTTGTIAISSVVPAMSCPPSASAAARLAGAFPVASNFLLFRVSGRCLPEHGYRFVWGGLVSSGSARRREILPGSDDTPGMPMDLVIRSGTAERWAALEDLFGKAGASNGCWCMYWRIGPRYAQRPRTDNRRDLHRLTVSGAPPGLLAFDGDV